MVFLNGKVMQPNPRIHCLKLGNLSLSISLTLPASYQVVAQQDKLNALCVTLRPNKVSKSNSPARSITPCSWSTI